MIWDEQAKLKNIIEVFSRSKLATGIPIEDFNGIFRCLHFKIKSYKKDELIIGYDETVDKMGMIIFGSIDFSIVQFDGSVALINRLHKADIFAEVLACCNTSLNVFEYRCVKDSEVLFLDIPKACTAKAHCTHSYKYKVMENLMTLIAEDNIFLNKKIFILSQKKLRDKLLSYFQMLQPKKNKERWIPFNRQDLANFISADRSAVSRELMRMQDNGLIKIKSNEIKIIST